MPRHYATHVCITAHAHLRWRLRAPGQDEPGPQRIMCRLNNLLRLGAIPDATFCIDVPVSDHIVAVCSPQFEGGWKCVTFEWCGVWARFNREAAR